MTPEQKTTYLEKQGQCCPYCESDNIMGDIPEMDGTQGWQPVYCLDCGEEWIDLLKLVGVEEA